MRQWRINIGDGFNYSEPIEKNVALAAFKAISETNDDKTISLIPVYYIIMDCNDNVMFNAKKFRSFPDGWSYIYENMSDSEIMDVFVVMLSDNIKEYIKLQKKGVNSGNS